MTKNNDDVCNITCIHQDVVARVRETMPDPVDLYELADFFKLFSDSTRIGILWALGQSELCVCDISTLLGMKQSAVSHQLRNLKQSRIVKYRREGKVVYYSLDDDHIKALMNLGMEHVLEIPGR